MALGVNEKVVAAIEAMHKIVTGPYTTEYKIAAAAAIGELAQALKE